MINLWVWLVVNFITIISFLSYNTNEFNYIFMHRIYITEKNKKTIKLIDWWVSNWTERPRRRLFVWCQSELLGWPKFVPKFFFCYQFPQRCSRSVLQFTQFFLLLIRISYTLLQFWGEATRNERVEKKNLFFGRVLFQSNIA